MIHGFVLAVVCIAITAPFLAMFTDKRSIIEMGTEYAKIVFIFAVPNAAGLCFEKIFQSVGRMKTSMLCMLVGCVSNIILDPLMIFGIGIFLKWESVEQHLQPGSVRSYLWYVI